MPIQSGTYRRLPDKKIIQKRIELEKQHNDDLISYLLYVIPLADKFGDRVYEVAAKALTETGLSVTADVLRALAEEFKTPDGLKRCSEQRHRHIFGYVTG